MSLLRIALLQILPHGNDQEANRAKGERYCRQARALGADVALFPEMWNIGYTPFDPIVWSPAFDPEDERYREAVCRWQEGGIDAESEFVRSYRNLARELEMAIGLTCLESWPGAPRNTLFLIDRHGELVLTYAKVHTCDFSMEAACTPGDDFPVCTLDTAVGPVNVGAMICFDREFPESARILMLQGAEIILTPNACLLEENRLAQFRGRAFENMVGLAMANYPAPHCNGHSIAFEPVMFEEDERTNNPLLIEAGEEEGIFVAEFDLDRLRSYREREVWGNAFRKPHLYAMLTDPRVEAPFIRPNGRSRKP